MATDPKKTVVVDDSVRMGMATLSPDERVKVENALSWDTLAHLAKTADRAGPKGKLRVADVTDKLRLVFSMTPQGMRVSDLISKRFFEQMAQATRKAGNQTEKAKARARRIPKFPPV